MATNLGQELSSVTFSQKPSSQGSFDSQAIGLTTKLIEHYDRELKRVFGSLLTTVSEIDSQTGQLIKRFFVPKEYEQQLKGVVTSTNQQLQGLGLYSQDKQLVAKDFADAHLIETIRELKGAKAQQYAKEELIDIGGTIKHTAGTTNKDIMSIYVPVLDTNISGMSSKDLSKMVRDFTPLANRASAVEQAKRTKDELERDREAQIDFHYKHKKQIDRENEKRTRESERAYKKEQREKLRAEAEEDKEKELSKKALIGTLGRIGTAVALIVDITRRILTSVLDFGQQTAKDTNRAHTLETNYLAQRNMSYMDKALGLGEGVSLQAQEDLRAKFGNTAKIDTESLKWLAMVMGEEVGTMVMSGLGGENPAKLMERILDDFYKRWTEGKDQYGNEVGQDKARRSLVTLLDSVSPNIARIFERMVEEQTSGLHAGQISGYKQFQSLYIPASGGLTGNDWEMLALLGKETDNLKATFKNLGETIKGGLLLSIQGLINWLDKLGLGKTATEHFEEQLSDSDRLFYRRSKLESEQKSRIGTLSKYFGNKDIKEVIKLAKRSTDVALLPEQNEEILEAKRIMQNIFADSEGMNELELYLGTEAQLNKLQTDINKGKAYNEVYYSDTGLIKTSTEEARTYLDELGYSKRGAFTFSENDFKNGTWQTLAEKGFTLSDVAEGKQSIVKEAGLKMFKHMLNYKDKDKAPEFTALQKALKANNISLDQWREMMENPQANIDTLMSIYTKLISPNNREKVKKGGLDLTKAEAKAIDERAKGYLLYSSDQFGLNQQEWENIYEAQKKVKLNAISQSYGKQIGGYEYTYRRGNSGQIEMTVRVVDNKGNLLNEYKQTVAGTLEQDFKQTVNGNLEKLND